VYDISGGRDVLSAPGPVQDRWAAGRLNTLGPVAAVADQHRGCGTPV